MKLRPLILSVAALYCLSFQCYQRCDTPLYGFDFLAVSTDSLKLFDSIVNVSEGTKVWERDFLPMPSDTVYGSASWNPEKDKTTMVFYSSKGVDTLVINYSYDAEYDGTCERYYFYLNYSSVEYCTFENFDFVVDHDPYLTVNLD